VCLVTEYAPATPGEYLSDIPQVSKDPLCCKKYFKDYKYNSLHLTFQVFVLGHHLFLKAHSFPQALFLVQIMSANKISKHIFMPHGGYYLSSH